VLGFRLQGYLGDRVGVDHRKGARMSDDTQEVKGEAELINWACTNCGYRVEGELPEKCPDCGADKEMFDEVPVPGY
jgi:rubrerythrin